MKIKLLMIGKTDSEYIKQGLQEYEKRIRHYVSFEPVVVAGLKNTAGLTIQEVKIRESEQLLKHLTVSDFVVLLDESGREVTSVEFSGFLNQQFASGKKTMVFIIGGAFGVDDSLKRKANVTLGLSRMTFSHQMVRLFFLEQLYRGLTILKNESYHH